jgi:replication factor A2
MAGSQNESPGAKRSYGKDSLRPVTIKQLIDAHHPHPDAEHFMIDGAETTQVTFVGQIRNISKQTTNVTYKLDDGTGSIEVKVWIDAETYANQDESNQKPEPVEQQYVRVWGRMKAFNNRRHVGATIVRPIQDFNEIQYHLLEATAVHLHFSRGSLESMQAKGGANGAVNGGYKQQNGAATSGSGLPPSASMAARRIHKCLMDTDQGLEGLHMQTIAMQTGLDISEVQKAGDELQGLGLIYTTVDDNTWAILDI